MAVEAIITMFARGEVFAGARAGEYEWMATKSVKCLLVLGKALFLAPVGVEVGSVPWAIGNGDPQPVDDPKNVFEVDFAKARAVEVINAEQDTALVSDQ